METTTEFPLDIKCTLLFSPEDLLEYDKLKREQEASKEAVGTHGNHAGQILPGVVEVDNYLDADV